MSLEAQNSRPLLDQILADAWFEAWDGWINFFLAEIICEQQIVNYSVNLYKWMSHLAASKNLSWFSPQINSRYTGPR